MNVKMFMLSFGAEVIARVVSETDDVVVVEKPYMVQVAGMNGGHLNIQTAPLSVGVYPNGTLPIKKSAMLTEMYDAPADMEKNYLQMTSGIQLAK